jgi:hypothetical protein
VRNGSCGVALSSAAEATACSLTGSVLTVQVTLVVLWTRYLYVISPDPRTPESSSSRDISKLSSSANGGVCRYSVMTKPARGHQQLHRPPTLRSSRLLWGIGPFVCAQRPDWLSAFTALMMLSASVGLKRQETG